MATRLTSSSARLSRRAALTRLGAGGVGMVLAGRSLVAGAQEATPPAVADLPPVLQEYITGFTELDIDRVIATLAEDATYEEVPVGAFSAGRDAIRAHLDGFLAEVSDVAVRYTSAFAAEHWAAGEWQFSGRYTGQLPEFPPGADQLFTIQGVDIIEMEADQIRAVRQYHDLYGFLIQLGVIPAPEPVATPPA